jgi:hypothetical protein
MRVLVSVDMEGVAGIVSRADIGPGKGDYPRNQSLITEEANAAVRGVFAYDAGADVLVTEGHAVVKRALGAFAAALLHPETAVRCGTRRRTSRLPATSPS